MPINPKPTLTQCFAAVLRAALGGRRRGFKTEIARKAGITTSKLADMEAGRYGSEANRRAVAAALGESYDGMLEAGRAALTGEGPATAASSGGSRESEPPLPSWLTPYLGALRALDAAGRKSVIAVIEALAGGIRTPPKGGN
jgi:hypothetical protein